MAFKDGTNNCYLSIVAVPILTNTCPTTPTYNLDTYMSGVSSEEALMTITDFNW